MRGEQKKGFGKERGREEEANKQRINEKEDG